MGTAALQDLLMDWMLSLLGREHSRIISRFLTSAIVWMVVPFIRCENCEEQVGKREIKSFGLVLLSWRYHSDLHDVK